MARVAYDGYAFTVDEMHAVVADARRVANPARAMVLGDLINFDVGRALAIVEYYHTIFVKCDSARPAHRNSNMSA
jgi:hypothetical protein